MIVFSTRDYINLAKAVNRGMPLVKAKEILDRQRPHDQDGKEAFFWNSLEGNPT